MFRLFSHSQTEGRTSLGQHSVKSAMTPIFWVCAIVSPTCLGTATLIIDKSLGAAIFLIVVGVVPIFTACGVYVYFALKDPDRLHSEEYRLKHQALSITERKGGELVISPVEIESIANPYPAPRRIEPAKPESGQVDDDDEEGGDLAGASNA